MDIQTRKIEFIQEFLKLQNEELIILLDNFLHSRKSATNSNFQPMSLVELNNRIDKSMDDSKNGRLTSSNKLKEEVKQWG